MSGSSEIMLSCPMKIIEYSSQYRDDMIFMVLEAKNALGRIPHLNEDLLDIQGHYDAGLSGGGFVTIRKIGELQ